MPIYTFTDERTGKTWDEMMSIADKQEYLKDNPRVKQVFSQLNIGDPVRLGVTRPDSSMHEVLSKAKAAHPKGNVDTGNARRMI